MSDYAFASGMASKVASLEAEKQVLSEKANELEADRDFWKEQAMSVIKGTIVAYGLMEDKKFSEAMRYLEENVLGRSD